MSKEKMSKEIKKEEVKKEEVKKIKLNVNYVDFICKVIKEKLGNLSNKELRELYLKNVKVKSYSNIKRVGKRVVRSNLMELLKGELIKRNVDFNDFIKMNNDLMIKISERKESNNYIEV